MNKHFLIISFITFIIILSGTVQADSVPMFSHYVEKCEKFVNLEEYPDIVLVGFVKHVGYTPQEAYLIENNVCLHKGYKFNSLQIYWATKEEFAGIDINNLTLKSVSVRSGGYDINGNPSYHDVFSPADLRILLNANPYEGHVQAYNPLTGKTVEHYITGNGLQIVSKSTSNYRLLPSKTKYYLHTSHNTTERISKKAFRKTLPSN